MGDSRCVSKALLIISTFYIKYGKMKVLYRLTSIFIVLFLYHNHFVLDV